MRKTNRFNYISGYVVQGSNGEFAYMDPEERVELVQKVREFAPKEKLIIAGAGCEGIYSVYIYK